MGQAFNKKGDTETIRLISDNPGITCNDLLIKLECSSSTIQHRIKRMCEETRVFRQTRNVTYGKTYHLFTTAYAKKHKVPRIYADKTAKSTLELQMMFHDCMRSGIVV